MNCEMLKDSTLKACTEKPSRSSLHNPQLDGWFLSGIAIKYPKQSVTLLRFDELVANSYEFIC